MIWVYTKLPLDRECQNSMAWLYSLMPIGITRDSEPEYTSLKIEFKARYDLGLYHMLFSVLKFWCLYHNLHNSSAHLPHYVIWSMFRTFLNQITEIKA